MTFRRSLVRRLNDGGGGRFDVGIDAGGNRTT
jgi:hypothetical protein